MVRKSILFIILLLLKNLSYCQVSDSVGRLNKCDDYYRPGFGYPANFPIFDENYPENHWDKL